jgi:hypothetical protein
MEEYHLLKACILMEKYPSTANPIVDGRVPSTKSLHLNPSTTIFKDEMEGVEGMINDGMSPSHCGGNVSRI